MTTATQTSAIAKLDKATIAQRWIGLKNKLAKAQKVGTEIATKALQSGTTVAGFGALLYWRERRKLAGKSVTFDKKGRVDAFFWPGLAVAIAGCTPFTGEAGPYVTALGSAGMCVGSVDWVKQLALDHHNKKK